jgi:hypothetical protein
MSTVKIIKEFAYSPNGYQVVRCMPGEDCELPEEFLALAEELGCLEGKALDAAPENKALEGPKKKK